MGSTPVTIPRTQMMGTFDWDSSPGDPMNPSIPPRREAGPMAAYAPYRDLTGASDQVAPAHAAAETREDARSLPIPTTVHESPHNIRGTIIQSTTKQNRTQHEFENHILVKYCADCQSFEQANRSGEFRRHPSIKSRPRHEVITSHELDIPRARTSKCGPQLC